jgi:hypothetical protein
VYQWIDAHSGAPALEPVTAGPTPRYGVFVHSAERRLSVCWSKNEREQWERERFEREREAERLARISSTRPKANEPEPRLESEEREGELIRS